MKILLFGKNGQIGWELHRSLQCVAEVVALGREDADFREPESLRNVIQEIKPDVIINAVAYTDVDRAEEDNDTSYTINSLAPAIIAEEAKKINALLVHYSTDYVFDGKKIKHYEECDETNPLNVYGASKLMGEKAVMDSDGDCLVIRTSWVYSSRGNNFLVTMCRLMNEKEELSVVCNQYGAPTWSRYIADATVSVLESALIKIHKKQFTSEILNITAKGVVSWYDYANEILKLIGDRGGCLKTKVILPVSAQEFHRPAARPEYSNLDVSKVESEYNINCPDWSDLLELCIEELVSDR